MDISQRSEFSTDESDIICDTLAASDQRSLVLHLLYALDAFDYQVSLESIADNFGRGFGVIISKNSDVFQQVHNINQEREQLDTSVLPLLSNWRIERLGICTRLILRLALWELEYTSIDPIIIINEAIELAKCFAEKDAYKFVNGILDELIKQRPSKNA